MTAVSVIRKRDSISIITDAAGYNDSGLMACFLPGKCMVFPEASCAVAIRGLLPLVIIAQKMFRVWIVQPSFEGLLRDLPDAARQCVGLIQAEHRKEATQSEISVAGWSSARQRFEHWLLPLHGQYDGSNGTDKCPPWQLTLRDGDSYSAPPPAGGFQCPAVDEFDLEKDGVELLEAQRAYFGMNAAGDKYSAVGGLAQIATVTRDAITSKILKRWPDEVGKPIEVAAPTPSWRNVVSR